jgi:hypothetical protein
MMRLSVKPPSALVGKLKISKFQKTFCGLIYRQQGRSEALAQ